MTRVLLLGGSGFIGRRIARQLTALGIRSTIPSRNRERAKPELLVLPLVDLVAADIHDSAMLSTLIHGVDAVINLVGVLHDSSGEFSRSHVQLPGTVAQLCERHGVPRLLHVSALHADSAAASKYLRSKADGEAAAMRSKSVAVTLFRPSVVFGEGDQFLTRFAQLASLSPVFPLAGARTRFQPVYAEDVARAIALSVLMPETRGQTYELCGPSVYTLADLVRLAANARGRHPVVFGLPHPLAYLQALLLEHLPGRLLTRDNLASMRTDSVASNPAEPFPKVFGFGPTKLESVASAYLQPVHSRYDGFRARPR